MTSSASVASKIADSSALRFQWQALLQKEPKLRIRDAAAQLGVSEAELLATGVGESVTVLTSAWGEMLAEMPKLGRVMCLTRNESVVHERKGTFSDVTTPHGMGLVVGPDIDLRIFLREWAFGFAVAQKGEGPKASLQFFDAAGTAIMKIYLTESSDVAAYAAFVTQFTAPEQSQAVAVRALPAPKADRPDSEIDVAGLRAEWLALKDTHDFYLLLVKYKVGRHQALRLVGSDLARPVANTALRQVLETASADKTEIMVFVGNRGNIQIHTGPVEKVVTMGPWINVMDECFNLHAREDHVANSWWVRKPSADGDIHSIELFDAKDELIATFFGKRKPGIPEAQNWRDLLQAQFPQA